MEEKIDGKKKSVASIPDNYVSILELQERWLKEKQRKQKQKESVERGGKKQQGRREEEDVMKVVKAMEARDEIGLGGGFRMHCGVNPCKKEPKCVKKEELEVGDSMENKKNNRVKDGTLRVCTSNGENAAKEETQFQDRWINKEVEEGGETREVKGPVRLNSKQGYYQNQRHDWSSTRVIRATTRTMVWVKKANNNGAAGQNGV